jgi:hypothetical protein
MTRLAWARLAAVFTWVVVICSAGMAAAGIPAKINYQGRLTDSATGLPLAGSHTLTFRIYDAATEGSLLWSETKTETADSAGVFATILGSVDAISMTFDGPCWLEAEADGEILLPRREMVSVAYAFHAMDADRVPALGTPGTINAADNPVDWTKLKGVPAGFVDGVDNVGGTGDGYSLDAVDGSPTDVVYVDGEGRVGIRTTSPSEALDVVGNINVTDALKINGATAFRMDSLNTYLGKDAGWVTGGSRNTFVGGEAGYSNESGVVNTFVGAESGRSNTSGAGNTFIGGHAGSDNRTGSSNTFVGGGAGGINDDGEFGTFVGGNAGGRNKSGSYNVFIGASAGWGNGTGSENTCVGTSAVLNGVLGSSNTIVGFKAGYNCRGSGNVFIGSAAGGAELGSNKLYIANGEDSANVLIHGDFSTGRIGLGTTNPQWKLHLVGDNPRILIEASSANAEVNFKNSADAPGQVWSIYKSSTAGDLRFFQGGDKMTIQDGTGNVGIGAGGPTEKLSVAGNINLTGDVKVSGSTVLSVAGSGNTKLGIGAGAGTGGTNTFVGGQAGLDCTTGGGNTFVGESAGQGNTTGNSNTFVGVAAGAHNGKGLGNCFFGASAGAVSDSGGQNVFVGGQCGFENRTGSYNTFVGDASGHENVAGEQNVCLGQAAGALNESGSYNTCLGVGAGHDDKGSRNVFVGYRAGAGETGSDKLYVSNGPVASNVLIYGDFAEGSVGIGTVEPDTLCRLHVDNPSSGDSAKAIYGVASSTGDYSKRVGVYGEAKCTGGHASGTGVYGHASGAVGTSRGVCGTADAVQGQGVMGLATHPTGMNVGVYGSTESPNGWGCWFSGAKNYLGGNVGIGETDPQRQLHIKGDGPRVLIEAIAGNPEVNLKTAGDGSADIWAVYKHVTDGDLHFYQNGDRVTFQKTTGNVAIGATDPAGYRLYVNGTAYATGSWQSSDLRLKTDLLGIDDALGKVLRLRGVSFRWRREENPDRGLPDGRHYGLVAQEVEEVLPEVVGKGPGDEKALAYSELIPVLVEAVKELKTESDELRAENQSLRQRLEALERDGGR